MDTKLNNRTILMQLVRNLSDAETQQMLAYAAGYEAGRISQISVHEDECLRNPPIHRSAV